MLGFPFEDKLQTFEKHLNCLNGNFEKSYSIEFKGGGAMVNNMKKNIAFETCRFMKLSNKNLDYNKCVNKMYKPSKIRTNLTIVGSIVRIHEDNVYGMIKSNIYNKKLRYYYKKEIYTQQRIALVEYDNYSEVLVNSRGHSSIDGTLWGYNENKKTIKYFTTILDKLNIKYTLIKDW